MSLSLPQILRMAGFLGLGFLAIAVEIAPVGFVADATPSPDLLFCLTAYCALRRPEAVPLILVFLIGLCRDFVADSPLGAGALSLVLATVILAEARGWFLTRPLVFEWVGVGLIFAASLLLQWLLILATLAPPPYLTSLGLLVLVTMAAYLPLALVLRLVLRIDYAPEFRRLGGAP